MKKILVRPGIGILAAVAALAVAGIAYASIPDGSGVIHGCYSKPSKPGTPPGSLRVVDTGAGQSCDANEVPLTWNQQGQRGTTGPQGPQGSAGPAGPTGPAGPAGAAGPTYFDGSEFLVPVPSSFTTLASETITGQQAGLNVITAPVNAYDLHPTSGGHTFMECNLVDTSGELDFVTFSLEDQGGTDQDVASATLLGRQTLPAGDVVSVECTVATGDENEAGVRGSLLIEHVDS